MSETVIAGNYRQLDASIEAVVEPFIAWCAASERMSRDRARQMGSPLRLLLAERSADDLARIRTEDLHRYSAYVNRTKTTGKLGRQAHRLWRKYRGVA